jgi:hypothetical protein
MSRIKRVKRGTGDIQIIVTEHAKRRLVEERQSGIVLMDIVEAAASIPGRILTATRFRGFLSSSGRLFDIVAKDIKNGRLVITVIGK